MQRGPRREVGVLFIVCRGRRCEVMQGRRSIRRDCGTPQATTSAYSAGLGDRQLARSPGDGPGACTMSCRIGFAGVIT